MIKKTIKNKFNNKELGIFIILCGTSKFLLDFLIAQNATNCLKDRRYVECKEKKGFATDLIVETQIPYNKCIIHCEGPYPFEIKEMEEILATQKRKSNERILYRTSFEE